LAPSEARKLILSEALGKELDFLRHKQQVTVEIVDHYRKSAEPLEIELKEVALQIAEIEKALHNLQTKEKK
jgi:predicted AAA+ superfamily ATPase